MKELRSRATATTHQPPPLPSFRLLALDIDGTLVNSQDELTEPTRQALHRARAAGLRIVLVTGRRYRRALPLAEALGLDAPLVTASGALIKHPADDHRTLHRAELAPDVLRATLAVIDGAGYEAVVYSDSFHEGFDFFCTRNEVVQPELAEYLRKNAGWERILPKLMTDPPSGVFAGFAIGTRPAMQGLADELQQRIPGKLYTHVIRSPMYAGYMCEISRAGSTKWSGIRHLADDWGIAADEICAVGDDVNDLPMIEGAGLGIAMDNAVPELKAVADWIAPGHDEDGLVAVVRRLLGE
jgi:Cof subfamily protein (haloacid dehalogenase superfamily)